MTTFDADLAEVVKQYAEQFAAFLRGDLTLDELQDATGLDAPDIYACLNNYVGQVNDVSREYNLGGDQEVNLPQPPPVDHDAPEAVYRTVVEQYQTNIVNDYSTNVQQIFNNDGDVNINQAIAGAGGTAINDSTVEDSLITSGGFENTGNIAVGNEGDTQQNQGDVSADDGGAASVFGDAETTGSGNEFGEGSQGNVQANSGDVEGDLTQQSNQADTDVNVTGTGGGGGAGGDGGAGGAEDADGGAGGEGGGGGDGIDDSPITVTVDQDNRAPDAID